MFWIAAFTFLVVGELTQPPGWLALAGGAAFGLTRWPPRWALPVALVATALEYARQHVLWVTSEWTAPVPLLFAVFVAISAGGWLVGRLTAELARAPGPRTQS